MFLNYANPVSTHGLNDGLVSWWKVLPHRNAGGTFYDLRGRNDGTFQDMAPSWANIRSSQGGFGSVEFTGVVDDRVQVADSDSLDETSNITVAAWVYARAGDSRGIVEKTGAGDDINLFWLLFLSSAGTLAWRVHDGANKDVSSPSFPLNSWHHVCGTLDGNTSTLYLDGILVGSPNIFVGVLTATTGNLYIGHLGFSIGIRRFPFDGYIDDVRVYNRTLPAGEVALLYELSRLRFNPLLRWGR